MSPTLAANNLQPHLDKSNNPFATVDLHALDEVVFCVQNNVGYLLINRPSHKNAIHLNMYQALADALNTADTLADVKALIIFSVHEHFTTGNDLSEFFNPLMQEINSPPFAFLHALNSFSKPLIMVVNGYAIGIGTTMLLHADFVYAHPNSVFQMPFTNLALCPEGASSLLLQQRCGALKANELLLLGDRFNAEQAQNYHIINTVCTTPLAQAQHTAHVLIAKSHKAITTTKALLKNKQDIATRLDIEAKALTTLIQYPDMQEAITALKEKRTPHFTSPA